MYKAKPNLRLQTFPFPRLFKSHSIAELTAIFRVLALRILVIGIDGRCFLSAKKWAFLAASVSTFEALTFREVVPGHTLFHRQLVEIIYFELWA